MNGLKLSRTVGLGIVIWTLIVPTVFCQKSYQQFALNIGIGKDISNDNPWAGNVEFGYEFTPIRKFTFFTLEPRLCTSFLLDDRVDVVDRWDAECTSYGLGVALAPKFSLANEERDFMVYIEYELSAINYFSKSTVHQNFNTIYAGKSNYNTFVHYRWRGGFKSPKLLKDGKHKVGLGAWIGFTSIRMDKIIQAVTPDRFDKYFTNLPLDGEFGMTFYF